MFNKKLLRFILTSAIVFSYTNVFAEDENELIILSTEGTAGERDRDGRAPNITISTNRSDTGTKILVAGNIPNEEYAKYPIRYEFYINRQLISTQLYSPELPGPIGIDVTENIARIPFNYSIIAQVIHPNRSFSTTALGAVTETSLNTNIPTSTLDCTLTNTSGAETTYEISNTSFTNSGNNTQKTFTATESGGSSTVNVSVTLLTGSDSDAGSTINTSGSLSLGFSDTSIASSVNSVSGSLALAADSSIESINISNSSSNIALKCDKTETRNLFRLTNRLAF